MAGLRVTKVIHDLIPLPIKRGQSGLSIGEIIDRQIEKALSSGDTLSEVLLSFEEDDWSTLVEDMGTFPRHNK